MTSATQHILYIIGMSGNKKTILLQVNAECIGVASYGALGHAPLYFRLICLVTPEPRKLWSLSLDFTWLLTRTRIYRHVVLSLFVA